jgi:uncharacterized membrane protein YkvA (DUF1232 family)
MKKFMKELKEQFMLHRLMGIVVASAVLGYTLFPWNLIPNSFPIVGYVDEVLVVIVAYLLGSMIGRKVFGDK